MNVINKSSILFFLFIISFSLPSNAVIDYKPDAEIKTTIVKKRKKAKKKGLFKRWKEKFFLKKMKKLQKKVDDKTISKAAKTSLKVGVSSTILLAIGIFTLFSPILAVPFICLAAALFLAIFADILSLAVLRKTKHDKEKYKKERRQALIGLFFALLTGIIPLLAFLSIR